MICTGDHLRGVRKKGGFAEISEDVIPGDKHGKCRWVPGKTGSFLLLPSLHEQETWDLFAFLEFLKKKDELIPGSSVPLVETPAGWDTLPCRFVPAVFSNEAKHRPCLG
ncbi:hypothetical protein H8959_010067 [Pygathrix nigripes]